MASQLGAQEQNKANTKTKADLWGPLRLIGTLNFTPEVSLKIVAQPRALSVPYNQSVIASVKIRNAGHPRGHANTVASGRATSAVRKQVPNDRYRLEAWGTTNKTVKMVLSSDKKPGWRVQTTVPYLAGKRSGCQYPHRSSPKPPDSFAPIVNNIRPAVG